MNGLEALGLLHLRALPHRWGYPTDEDWLGIFASSPSPRPGKERRRRRPLREKAVVAARWVLACCLALAVAALTASAFVAFSSAATNLNPADNDRNLDVYVRDLQTNTTTLVSRAGRR